MIDCPLVKKFGYNKYKSLSRSLKKNVLCEHTNWKTGIFLLKNAYYT